jgi:hypothetical protein
MLVQTGYWAAVRKTEGREWATPSEIGADHDTVQLMVQATNRKIGEAWAKNNPCISIVKVEIREVS